VRKFNESELIINPDGSVYHLCLKPENIADTVILVGDPQRVEEVSKYFDKIEFRSENREFVTHTGYYNKERITVLSSGIGADNIDIVINELDAAINIDLKTRQLKKDLRSLKIIRIGTSGALQSDIDVDSFVASSYGLGLDGLIHFYGYENNIVENDMVNAFIKHSNWNSKLASPYIVKHSGMLFDKITNDMKHGITATAPGFFGPQGRQLRIPLADAQLNSKIESFRYSNRSIVNFEMETSAIYALGKILGHETLTVCAVIANRITKKFSKDYKKTVNQLILTILDRITSY